MIGYVTIGVLDGEASGRFYDAVFNAIGSERKLEGGGWIGYGVVGPGKDITDCHTALCPPFNGQPASPGNGVMIAYQAQSADQVKSAYAAGLAAGGTSEGEPGFRPAEAQSGFYASYLRDPAGNKINIFTGVSAA